MGNRTIDPFSIVTRALSLSDKVVEQLTEAILSKKLRAGDRLPSERDLGEKFKVSRTVVREAVRSLAAKGLVKVTSGRGLEVNAVDSGNVAESMRLLVRGHEGLDYGKVHEVRMALEVQTAGLAAERATPQHVSRLRSACDRHAECLERKDYAGAGDADFDFHRELTSAAGNELMVAMLDSISDVLREIRNQIGNRPHVSAEGLQAHRRILKFVVQKKGASARQAMADHLDEAERVWRGGGEKRTKTVLTRP